MTITPSSLIPLSLIAGLFFAEPSIYFTYAHANESIPQDTAAQATHALVKQIGEQRFTAPDFRPSTVRHMVMFQFRPTATAAERQEVTRRFLELATHSRRPNGAPVVASLEAGPQNSGENADLGLDYGYLVTFRSEGDRNYYVGRPIVHTSGCFDPTHDAFKKFAAPFLVKVVVFDFTVK
ncbi:Dabb family protein [Acetobacter pasteurianus]